MTKVWETETIELPENTFYLASYPRSGNTWLLNALVMLLGAIRSEARSSFEHYPYLYGKVNADSFYLRAENELDASRPLVVKSHDACDVYESLYPRKKCIYIYRDGRDVLLSYYLFTKAFSIKEETIFEYIGNQNVLTARISRAVNFEAKEFAEFLQKHAIEWADHVERWLKADGILTLTYEDLYHDFARKLMEIVAYLEIEPATNVNEVKRVYVDDFRQFFSGDSRQFFRKGIIGDWRNHFTGEHKRIFFELAGELLVKLGYDEHDVSPVSATDLSP